MNIVSLWFDLTSVILLWLLWRFLESVPKQKWWDIINPARPPTVCYSSSTFQICGATWCKYELSGTCVRVQEHVSVCLFLWVVFIHLKPKRALDWSVTDNTILCNENVKSGVLSVKNLFYISFFFALIYQWTVNFLQDFWFIFFVHFVNGYSSNDCLLNYFSH